MSQIILDDSELIGVIVNKKVGDNGQISIGKEHSGKFITAYIVLGKGSEQIKTVEDDRRT